MGKITINELHLFQSQVNSANVLFSKNMDRTALQIIARVKEKIAPLGYTVTLSNEARIATIERIDRQQSFISEAEGEGIKA